jgi:hypothetical protein
VLLSSKIYSSVVGNERISDVLVDFFIMILHRELIVKYSKFSIIIFLGLCSHMFIFILNKQKSLWPNFSAFVTVPEATAIISSKIRFPADCTVSFP